MEPVADVLEDLQMYWLVYGRELVLPVVAASIFLGASVEIFRRLAQHVRLRRVNETLPSTAAPHPAD